MNKTKVAFAFKTLKSVMKIVLVIVELEQNKFSKIETIKI